MKILDAYDIGHKIIDIWKMNIDKSSGRINKDQLQIPILIEIDGDYKQITDIQYRPNIGIILISEDDDD